MTEDREIQIIKQIKSGDRGAFCELVDKYREKALKIAYSFSGNYEDAKDLSQEAFIKAFNMIGRFRGDSKFYTWFYRILVNICKDHLKQKQRHKTFSFFVRSKEKESVVEAEDIFEIIASSAPGPEDSLLNKELGAQLTGAINSLPDKQRTVFTLRNIHGLSIHDIAEITKTADGTVKAHLFKATMKLQRIMLEQRLPEGAQ